MWEHQIVSGTRLVQFAAGSRSKPLTLATDHGLQTRDYCRSSSSPHPHHEPDSKTWHVRVHRAVHRASGSDSYSRDVRIKTIRIGTRRVCIRWPTAGLIRIANVVGISECKPAQRGAIQEFNWASV